jgi:iron complex outermembrane receptor protein
VHRASPFRLSPLTAALLGAGTLLAGAAPAWAQTQPPPARPTASNELTTITVTANRRVEDQQKVGVSVTALTGESLAERNVIDLSGMEALVPGFTFGRSGADARPAIRGVRTENVAVNADTTIGFFVDGVYKSRAQQAMLGFVDVERVEVQRGPQGTLFGRNTFGGNIAIGTVAPQFKANDASASLSIGSFARWRAEAVVNAPLGNDAALRLVGAAEKADPWVRNDFNPAAGQFDQNLKYARASFRSRPVRDVEVVLRTDLTSQGGNGGSAFGYKQAGTYLHTASCQQLFNATKTVFNVRPGNRDAVTDCTRTVGAGAGTGANAIGSPVDLGIPLYRAGDTSRIDNDQQTFLNTNDFNASAEISWRRPDFTLKSITALADFSSERSADSDFSASTIAVDYQRTAASTLSQEFQILSEGGGPLGYVAGLYYFRDELEGKFINQQLPRTIRSAAAASLSLAQNGAGFYDLQRPDTRSTALYAQLSWKISEPFTLTVGGRYTRDQKDFKFANANSVLPLNASGAPDGTLITLGTATPPESAFGGRGATNCTGSNAQPGFNCLPGTNTVVGATYNQATFSKATGRLSLDWRLSQQSLVYATASTGFRSGGFNSGQALEGVRTFRPEEVRALEIGSKNRFLGNTLQVNAAAFANRYTDLQEQRQIPIGATTVSTIFNAAKAKANGFELETQWRPTASLSLGGSLSLLDAKYTSFPDVALPFGTSILVADPSQTNPQTDANGIVIAPAGQRRIFAPGYNCRVVPGTGGTGQPAAAFGCDLSGNRLPYSPERTLGFSVKYDIVVGGGTLSPLLQVNYSSGFFGQPTNAEIERQPAYTKLDFKLNWRISDTLALQASVDNLTDKQTINRFVWGGGGALQISGAPPRTIGLRLSYSNF